MTACALVGASSFNERDFLRRRAQGAFDGVIAVDGGLAHLARIGVAADVAMGDFDSLGYVPCDVPVVRHPPEKDDSDMALALGYAAEHGFGEFWIYGGLGGRLDHTIANLQEFALFSERGARVTAIDESCALALLTGPASLELPAIESGTVSVFAACDQALGVTEVGMKYGLDGFTLTSRTSRGLSNEFMGRPVRISVERGTLYVVCPLEAV